ncbi:hypothetical protein Q73_02100 [Bacillus coahuilensis m2-6]|uniref:recombination regulator RecX n=1 Tax=Bacillus coahuilensis TaxID=408580 RepID=UPI0007502227|nr:recombination regulator RecX [Bacillus coahuilensis]KUP09693.1 hypothetical protein Q73_02100 [Bacillus coahuilensis m2-6]
MGMISKITTQKRNTERYNLFINGKYAFSVDESVLTRFQLRKGLEIDEEDIHKIQQQDDIRKAINVAVHYLSFRMRSFKEIHDHLKEKEYEEVVIASAMEKIQELGYVNDLEFAIAYSNTQRATTDKGPIRIKQELQEKGVRDSFIQQVIEEYLLDEQVEKAIGIASKIIKKEKKASSLQRKQKVEQSLTRKGYPYSVISIVHEEVSYEGEENEAWEALVHQGQKLHQRYSTKYTGYEYEQRMKQALFRKGFSIQEIERLLTQLKENESTF